MGSKSTDAKIKTAKISETQILACFAKICTHENYQPYSMLYIVQSISTCSDVLS